MTREECIALLERYAEYHGMGIPNLAGCREAMKMAADLLSRPSLLSDLDEAAEEWCKINNKGIALSADKKSHYLAEGKDAFKAGAEWMAGQVWISVDEKLPEMDEEVIVLTDELDTAPIYKIAFGHIVDVERCIDYNGWNIPGVKYWMPCPEISNND